MVVLSAAGGEAIRRALLIVNPAARGAASRERRTVAALAAGGVDCTVVRTSHVGHAAELAGAGPAMDPPIDAVFTLGGDGTAMEVVGALVETGVPVGILPGGTGNLVARTLGIPLDPTRAVRALLAGTRARVDLGRVQAIGDAGVVDAGVIGPHDVDGRAVRMPARHFAFAAGVGIDARMIERTPAARKRRLGVLAYVLTAARAVIAGERFTVRAVVDGVEWRGEASAVMIVNFGAVLGDLFHFGPGIAADDGRLDLCIFAPRSLADAVRVLWRLARRDFRDDPVVHYRTGREFRVETVPPLPAQADGELLGTTPLIVQVVPLAATLLVPPGSGAWPQR